MCAKGRCIDALVVAAAKVGLFCSWGVSLLTSIPQSVFYGTQNLVAHFFELLYGAKNFPSGLNPPSKLF